MPLRLGVNVDHAATLRQARYARDPDSALVEPDPVAAALAAENAGADSITAHLREDRRHIQDRDIFRLQEAIRTKLNLEMGNSADILAIALQVRPHDACLVPENRHEVTTEGGLDCLAHRAALLPTIRQLQEHGIVVSLFIDPEPDQIRAAADLGAEYIELHTGAFANAAGDARRHELRRLVDGAALARGAGLRVNAGHGLNYDNVRELDAVPHLEELNIGHAIMARAIFTGLPAAVAAMKTLCEAYPAHAGGR